MPEELAASAEFAIASKEWASPGSTPVPFVPSVGRASSNAVRRRAFGSNGTLLHCSVVGYGSSAVTRLASNKPVGGNAGESTALIILPLILWRLLRLNSSSRSDSSPGLPRGRIHKRDASQESARQRSFHRQTMIHDVTELEIDVFWAADFGFQKTTEIDTRLFIPGARRRNRRRVDASAIGWFNVAQCWGD